MHFLKCIGPHKKNWGKTADIFYFSAAPKPESSKSWKIFTTVLKIFRRRWAWQRAVAGAGARAVRGAGLARQQGRQAEVRGPAAGRGRPQPGVRPPQLRRHHAQTGEHTRAVNQHLRSFSVPADLLVKIGMLVHKHHKWRAALGIYAN